VTRNGKYTVSTLSALTLHGLWISAIPAKVTSTCTTATSPSFQQGALESSNQGWEVQSIYILSTHPPWTLDLGNPCQGDEYLHNHHNICHSSRERWNPVTWDEKYTASTFSAFTFHRLWISAIPAKMTSSYTTITISVIPAGSTGI